MPDRVERTAQMVNRFGIGAASQRLGRGALVMPDRALRLVTAFEVLGKLRRNVVELSRPCGFEPTAHTRVERCAPRRREILVQQLAIEIVPERVELRARAVGP